MTHVNEGRWLVRYTDGHGDVLERVTYGILVGDKDGWVLVLDARTRKVRHMVWGENLVEVVTADD